MAKHGSFELGDPKDAPSSGGDPDQRSLRGSPGGRLLPELDPSKPRSRPKSEEDVERLRGVNERLIGGANERLPNRFLVGGIWDMIVSEANDQARVMNWGQAMFNNVLDSSELRVKSWIEEYLGRDARRGGDAFYFNTPEGFQDLFNLAWNRFASLNRDFGERTGISGGGVGSRGPSGPTAQEIRDSFDVNAMAQNVNQIWRNMLFTTPKNATAIANAFVEVMVKTQGKKTMDFTAFVRSRAMNTGRFAVIFKDKPDGMSPEQYLGQYTGTAAQVVRPGNVESVALGGARLGADAASFQSRLARSNEAITSAPFITNLEARVQNLSEVLRG